VRKATNVTRATRKTSACYTSKIIKAGALLADTKTLLSHWDIAASMPRLDEFLKTLKQDRLETLIRRVMQVPEGTRVRATESMVESLNELVRLVWDKMQLAGEAGSLLKIEEELQQAIRIGQEEWEEKQPLFRFTEFSLMEEPNESYVRYLPGQEVSFWQRAEALVLEALRDYARHAANGGRLQRTLFAEDAEHGFAFIDTCQKRFDVVLMNPPFGEATKPAKTHLIRAFPLTKDDIAGSFVERGLQFLCSTGIVGALTTRTLFFISSFKEWRQALLLKTTPMAFADLGNGVLDSALVETAAYCLQNVSPSHHRKACFFRVWDVEPENKAKCLAEASELGSPDSVFLTSVRRKKRLFPFATQCDRS
jgi:hypothetical protein